MPRWLRLRRVASRFLSCAWMIGVPFVHPIGNRSSSSAELVKQKTLEKAALMERQVKSREALARMLQDRIPSFGGAGAGGDAKALSPEEEAAKKKKKADKRKKVFVPSHPFACSWSACC